MNNCRLMVVLGMVATICCFGGDSESAAQEENRIASGLMQFPDVSDRHIVFSYSGDLWLAPREGGVATPLAGSAGADLFPRFDPEGDTIAFTGNYEGNRDVYTIPVQGGIAQRMTYHPGSETVCDWTADGKVVFSTNGLAGLGRMSQLFAIGTDQNLPEKLPVPYGTNASISEDGNWLAYTPHSRDSRTWKRYRGGMASDIWLFHLKDKTSQQITDWEGTDSLPMFHGDKVYYLSDAGPNHRLNIWEYDTQTEEHKQVTTFDQFDCKWPAIGPGPDGEGEIIVQNGFSLWLINLDDFAATTVDITIPGDRPTIRHQLIDTSDSITNAGISPTAKRVTVEARGDIWTLPAKTGPPRNLTATSGVAERMPAWSPDGRWVAYFADTTGEYELYVRQSDGRGDPRQLTSNGDAFRFDPVWSPDSKFITFTDKAGRVHLHALPQWVEDEQVDEPADGQADEGAADEEQQADEAAADQSGDAPAAEDSDEAAEESAASQAPAPGETVIIATDPYAGRPSVNWSHDSNYLTFALASDTQVPTSIVYIYDIHKAELHPVTHGFFNDDSPVFDRKGEFLYFSGSRAFNRPSYEDVGTSFIYADTEVLLAIPLRGDIEMPMLPESDEETWDGKDEGKDEDEDEENDNDEDEQENENDKDDEDDQEEDDQDGDDQEDEEDDSSNDGTDGDSGGGVAQSTGGHETFVAPIGVGLADPISGTWVIELQSDDLPADQLTATAKLALQSDGSVTGSVESPMGVIDLSSGRFDAASGELTLTFPYGQASVVISGQLQSDGSLKGTASVADQSIPFTATRTATAAGGNSGSSDADESAGGDTDKEESAKSFSIDFEGIAERAFQLPVSQGNFGRLAVNQKNQLIYARTRGRGGDGESAIKLFDVHADKPSEKTVVSGATNFSITPDGKKLLVRQGRSLSIINAAAGQKLSDKVPTKGMIAKIDPRQEWQQVFTDAWRIMRDYFYDPNMHGVDWKGIRDYYEILLKDCLTRDDVAFVIREMISEINVGHAYYRGGGGRGSSNDDNGPDARVGLLGCTFVADNGRYRIDTLFEGAAWDTDARNPLRRQGVQEGDYILQVNGIDLTTDINPYAAFQATAGLVTRLTISDDATLDDDDERILVEPLRSDNDLRFRHWIEQNRKLVEEKTEGRVGYIYVVNTGVPGQNDLFRQFYGQMSKDALIIDDRWNGGGQIPTRFIELLNRPVTNYWAKRDGRDWTWPPDSHQGPKCMLINGMAGSGGDMFPALFRQNQLGKLVGQRTWGGLVGISGNPGMIDGTSITAPTFAYYQTDGTWGIEGHGVDPDVDVIDDPAKMTDGGDPQLEAAIELMLDELKTNPYVKPDRPDYPDRSGFGIKEEDK